MAFSQAQLDALEKAYASGTTRVSYDGKTVDYRSLDEMKRIITEIRDSLDGTPTLRTIRVKTLGDKGL